MAAAAPLALLDQPDEVRLALSPIRRRLLARLSRPASATELAGELGLGRQRLNYHLRALEGAGLLSLVETRRKRGCIERILVRTARAFIVDPDVVGRAGGKSPRAVQDRFAAEHLIGAAAGIVRNVTRMQARADERRQRLLTFTIETDVNVATPADLERFSSELANAVARAAARFNTPTGGRRYRVVIGAHPAPRRSERNRT
jgi:DNA-binding transcriptional ArsR family regulator